MAEHFLPSVLNNMLLLIARVTEWAGDLVSHKSLFPGLPREMEQRERGCIFNKQTENSYCRRPENPPLRLKMELIKDLIKQVSMELILKHLQNQQDTL